MIETNDSDPLISQHLAAIDLGSNSFHMVVARIDHGHVKILDRMKEMVRLGGGLDENNNLSEEAQERALACLRRFGERLKHLPHENVAAVGTNTLRMSVNARIFLFKAQQALGHPISVIAGREEARLVYLGVSHSLAHDEGRRFVMDIGGGSTELIIGEKFEPMHLESLHMGCVSMSRRFFTDGNLGKKNWRKSNMAAHLELRPVKKSFRNIGWESATGASGTIKAVLAVTQAMEIDPYAITLDGMKQIRDYMIEAGHLDKLELPGLSEERKPVFAGGLSVLIATFEALRIEKMRVSDGALREGLIYDRLGRFQHEDIRVKTVADMQKRFQVSASHARRVSTTAHRLFAMVEAAWELSIEQGELLHWAASLHEVGLIISHSGYQKHGAYMIDNADLSGFSLEEQDWMSALVRSHRRKISRKLFDVLPEEDLQTALRLAALLRIATVLHRSREDQTADIKKIKVKGNRLKLKFKKNALDERLLLVADLRQEARDLKAVGIKLDF
ncbi:MAG TPA: exopolyphosphatase [Gammaproteobacteria bacterium]|nr:exopolyphosphatase [Gammaproteobacteria bacterium]